MLLFLLNNSLYALADYCKYLELTYCNNIKTKIVHNQNSQLTNLVNNSRSSQELQLMKIKFFENMKIEKLYTNGYNHVVVTFDNKIFVFGVNYHGLCCTGDYHQLYMPTEITKYITGNVVNVKINLHSIFLSSITSEGSHKLYCWGKGSYGELANFNFNDELYPREILYFSNVEIINIYAGDKFIFANTKNYLYSWGDNSKYQLGTSLKNQYIIRNKMAINKLELGSEFAVALSDMGEVYTWGDNTYGQLGINSKVNRTSIPNIICGIDEINDICAGSYHVLAKSETEKLYSWGDNSSGQLGIGSQEKLLLPKIIYLHSPRIIKVQNNTNIAICQDSHIFVWGENLNNMVEGFANIINCPVLMENEFNHIQDVKLGYLYSLIFADCGISVFGLNMQLLDKKYIKKFEYKFVLCT